MRLAAAASHSALYGLMIAMPLLGWGMLSAAAYPVELFPRVALPQSDALHTALVRRDGVFESMSPVPTAGGIEAD